MRRNRITQGVGGGNYSSGGPFYTDPLKDINLELDLLKRKREMLEQQQQRQFIQPTQNNFNQLPYYVLEQKPAATNRNFPRLYNNGSEQYSDGYEQYRESFTRKRESGNVWQHNSYPKKPAGQRQLSSSSAGPYPSRSQRPSTSRNQQTNSIPFKHKQGKHFIGQKINNQKQQTSSKEIVTNKVTKASKASVLPNKLASQPVAKRNKLVAAAVTLVKKIETNDREALRLLPDKEPTKQVTGRLELALGTILREIRDKFGSRPHYQLIRLQRAAKHIIRERIRNVMLGKIVGSTQEIVKEYRAIHPNNTDVEIANMALETESIKIENEPRLIEKDGSEDYFKTNMVKMIERHLHETFDKLENIYNPALSTGKEKTCSKEDTADDRNIEGNNAEIEKLDEIAKETGAAAKKENGAKSAANTNNFENAITGGYDAFNEYQKSLPKLLKRHIPTFLNLLHMSKVYRKDLDEIINNTRAKFVESDATQNAASTKRPAAYAVLPYYVKVMGKPRLPSKNEMNAFLEKFNPKSIKKHRTIRNLLFIGFTEKNGFDAVVKADGSVIGSSTLNIRVCDRNTSSPDDNASTSNTNTDQNASQSQDILNKSGTDSDILGSELDGQINDLLASIRKSEENQNNDSSKCDTLEEENTIDGIRGISHDDKIDVDNDEVLEKNGEPVEDNEQNENTHNIENKDTKDAIKVISHDDKIDVDNDEALGKNEERVEDNEQNKNNHNIENKDEVKEASEKNDQLAELKSTGGMATPTRTSTRLANTPATPNSIRTRRASRLMQN